MAAEPDTIRHCSVVLIGKSARRVLIPETTGRVAAIFRRSFDIAGDENGFACIGSRNLGSGPLNVLLRGLGEGSWEKMGLHSGLPVQINSGDLHVGTKLRIRFEQARVWRPRILLPDDHAAFLRDGLALLAELPVRPAPDGFGPWAGALARGAPLDDRDTPFLRRALPAVERLRAWLAAARSNKPCRLPPVPDEIAGLIGLGPGLTPSGDDCLGGVLIALRALGRYRIAETLWRWLVPILRDNTSAISRAHLAAAAEGQGAEALHDFLAALCTGDRLRFDTALAALDRIGHSSGRDALAGMLIVVWAEICQS